MLPIFQSESKEMSLLQTQWASQINPILALPQSKSIILKDVSLVSGDNVINHRLGRKLQGWVVTRMKDSFVQLYDKQSTNNMSDLTLVLNSSGSGLIDLEVF